MLGVVKDHNRHLTSNIRHLYSVFDGTLSFEIGARNTTPVCTPSARATFPKRHSQTSSLQRLADQQRQRVVLQYFVFLYIAMQVAGEDGVGDRKPCVEG